MCSFLFIFSYSLLLLVLLSYSRCDTKFSSSIIRSCTMHCFHRRLLRSIFCCIMKILWIGSYFNSPRTTVFSIDDIKYGNLDFVFLSLLMLFFWFHLLTSCFFLFWPSDIFMGVAPIFAIYVGVFLFSTLSFKKKTHEDELRKL